MIYNEGFRKRFLAKVNATDGCWLWTGAKLPKGYGVIGRGGRGAGYVYAHRASYEIYRAPIPAGLTIDHLCRNTSCVNPDHLEPVTLQTNLMRGGSMSANYARRTHCRAGHLLDYTLRSKGKTFRRCKICYAKYMQHYESQHPRRLRKGASA